MRQIGNGEEAFLGEGPAWKKRRAGHVAEYCGCGCRIRQEMTLERNSQLI